MPRSSADSALAFIRERGVVRARDLEAAGLSRMWLTRLGRLGLVERVGRGLYVSADAQWTEHHSLAEVAARVPHGVVCLLSALSLHGLTTQAPSEVWVAVDRKARAPLEPGLPIRLVRFSGAALISGVEERSVEGVTVRVYSPAKTVVDCFRYRNKIGLDVAIEALRDCYRQSLATTDELWEYASRLRVAAVMRPYLESLE